MHPLDRPIWNALTTVQSRFAQRGADAVRFDPEVTSLAACATPTPAALEGLVALLGGDEVTGLLFDEEPLLPSGLERVDSVAVAQMVHEDPRGVAHVPAPAFVELGVSDVPDMVDLAARTRPGPFARRSAELGPFVGVREGGRLLAMAGQRMRVPGHAEVSGVCTDPAALGRGLAGGLVAEVVRRVRAEGLTPFLHVKADNERAIGLYERLGFVARRRFVYLIVRR